jgi:hypothetical protein
MSLRDRSETTNEIEVTPAMERAGLEVFWTFDLADDDPGEMVREVFQAMDRVRRISLGRGGQDR